MNNSIALAQIVVDALVHYEIADIVISPGSRNAPLVNALMQRQEFNCYSCVDERSAGFKALGITLSSGKATALICTSGTAVLNYAPAICEAYYQGLPLVVISADRPEEWIDQGDGQTIRQLNALGSYVAKSMQLNSEWLASEKSWLIQRKIAEVFCCPEFVQQRRPIHLNVSFTEPLYEAKPQVIPK
ncbi:MAG: thiamine pyrophosphate-binding protein, partial [Luteibaculum sp.]